MNYWINTDVSALSELKKQPKDAGKVKVMSSPYDVPEAIRAYHSDDKLIIEFRYISISEVKSIVDGVGGIGFEIGEKTKRIYKIFIPEKTILNSDGIKIEGGKIENIKSKAIVNAIDNFISKQENFTDKYQATKIAVKNYKNELSELAFR